MLPAPPLHDAPLRGLEYEAKALIDRRANVNSQGGQKGNALRAALDGDHRDIMELLLDRVAEINAQDSMALAVASYVFDSPRVCIMQDECSGGLDFRENCAGSG